jgi:1,4-alpha-glucan branching enzyme
MDDVVESTISKKAGPAAVAAAEHAGMGAILYAGGVSFRVWAPHAEQVFLAGTFNDWSPEATPLAQEENGFWSRDMPGMHAGERYKYRIVVGEQELWRIDPYARQVTSSAGEAVVYDPGSFVPTAAFQAPDWNALVIYELHIGTFHRAAPDQPGTFDTAAEKLPYLRDLGVTAIQIMPPMEFPGEISWGYNLSQPFAIDTDYGGPDDFKRFIQTAHEAGLAVILDVVYNHFGPSDLDLWQFDGWQENDLGGIYFYNDERAKTPWGDTRPDFGRSEVRHYLRDNALMWLEEYGLDGLRFDATSYIRAVEGTDDPEGALPDGLTWLQWVNDEIDAHDPRKITIAEDMQVNASVTQPVAAEGVGFNSQWDPNFIHPVRAALMALRDEDRDIEAVAAALAFRYNDDAWQRIIYTESHDEVANGKTRVPDEIAPDDPDNWFARKRSTLGAALVFTAPGIPMIFQGQEFLSDAWFDDHRAVDWTKAETYAGILALYHDLIALRGNTTGVTAGLQGQGMAILHADQEQKVLAFHRWQEGGAGDDVVIVANFARAPQTDYALGFPATGTWKVRFNSDAATYGADFSNVAAPDAEAQAEERDGQPAAATIAIGPYSVVIFSQDKTEES